MYRKFFYNKGQDKEFKELDNLLLWVCEQEFNHKAMAVTLTTIYFPDIDEMEKVAKITIPYNFPDIGYVTATCYVRIDDLVPLKITDTDIWEMLDNNLQSLILDRLWISTAFMNPPEDMN